MVPARHSMGETAAVGKMFGQQQPGPVLVAVTARLVDPCGSSDASETGKAENAGMTDGCRQRILATANTLIGNMTV